MSEIQAFQAVIFPEPESERQAIAIWRDSLAREGGREVPESEFQIHGYSTPDGQRGVVVVGTAEVRGDHE